MASARRPTTNLVLFVATIISTFYVGSTHVDWSAHPLRGWVFAVPLMLILVTHEFGHWIQAKRHGVEASFPFFLPLPIPGGIGTLGAVISMRGRIRTRDALLDIGASGPLAGMLVAIPVLIIGLKLSVVQPIPLHGTDEGQSLLYLALKRVVLGPIPDGYDVFLHPTAFAGWVGLLLTMLNLIPVGQLDGGHVAYALFGPKQDRYSRIIHRSMLFIFAGVALYSVTKAWRASLRGREDLIGAVMTGQHWFVWWLLLALLTRFTNFQEHPPTEDSELSRGRRIVAWATLLLFALIFMPVPLSVH